MTTDSIGIKKWAGELEIEEVARRGEGDARMIAWERSDGARAIQTNGDPVWDGEEGFEEAWEGIVGR